jgi:hypothetical protein
MKVSSPVGNFPFEPERVQIDKAGLILEGKMGAWPARVEIAPSDGLKFARLLGPRVALPALGLVLAVSLVQRGRRSDG